jgi:phosphomannomutase/phosphoglucomutase
VVEHNVRALAERVRAENAACGVGLDGDGDRIGVGTRPAAWSTGDRLLALYPGDAFPACRAAWSSAT